MKIWFITNEFPPSFGGGIGMYIDIVSRGLAKAENQCTVITADEINQRKYINQNLLHIRFKRPDDVDCVQLGFWITLYKKFYQQVMNQIDREGAPDIIEMPEFGGIGYYILQAKYLGDKRLEHVKTVVHCHTPGFKLNMVNCSMAYSFPTYWIGEMEKFCIRAADGLLTQSKFLHDELVDIAPNKPFEVITLPYQIPQQTNAYECGEYLLYAGRLEYRKGIWQFLKSMSQHWEDGCKTPLVLVGGDVDFAPTNMTIGQMIRERYKKWIDDGLLTLQDKVPSEELVHLMMGAKAVVVPSIYENYPYINVIAMFNRVPVLVSKQGGQAEAVLENGVNGFIFDWDSENDCYRMIKEVLAKSEKELRAIGINGYNRICQSCNIDDNIQKRIAYYNNIMTQTKAYSKYPFNMSIPETMLPAEVAKTHFTPDLLSVVIPYYNLADTIDETINSILASEYRKLEIILLDDGSTDKAAVAKADKIAQEKKGKVHLVRIRNGGLANARNVGCRLAKGEYICFVDADDTVQPDYFAKSITLLKRYSNVSFVYSWVQYFGASNEIWTTFDTEAPYLCAQNQLTCMAVSRHKDYLAFGHNHVEMEYGLEDYDSWLGMVENGRFGVCIPETLVNYRVRSTSMARSMTANSIMFLKTQLAELHPNLYKQFGAELYLLELQNGSAMKWPTPLSTWNFTTPADSQTVALQNELNAIKNRRGYKLMDAIATKLYKLKIVRVIRYRLLPSIKHPIKQTK